MSQFINCVNFFISSSLIQKTCIKSILSISLFKFLKNISPFIEIFFLFPRFLSFFFTISIQVSVVTNSSFGITSTTRFAYFLLNRNILIMVNRNIISNIGGSSNKSLIFNRNIQIVLESILIGSFNSRSYDFFVLSKSRFRFIKINLKMFFSNIRSNDILTVINITRSFNIFFSIFILNNRLSFNRFIVINSILSIYESNFKIFFFNNWLDDWLIDISI